MSEAKANATIGQSPTSEGAPGAVGALPSGSLYDRAMDPRVVARVLTEIAETASETLELQDVFDRVAASVRELIPFDQMGVVRIIEGGRAVAHATTVPEKRDPECSQPCSLTSWSPRIRPRSGPNPRIDDAQVELDPSFPGDAAILAAGARSALW